ncbi:unannotated protein [freshwater metagenome]|uniref:Unannotated protein n=1 Tax=freshwater metagenome TaxID=449393 RepID=A0A6J7H2E2_9ZZZZ|nr:hypothetical protein [Actinomycetota bacterium]
MRAKSAYRLIVTRTGSGSRLFGGGDAVAHVEIQSLDDLEVVLYWDVPGRSRRRLEEAIRADLETLTPDEFLARWTTFTLDPQQD